MAAKVTGDKVVFDESDAVKAKRLAIKTARDNHAADVATLKRNASNAELLAIIANLMVRVSELERRVGTID